MNVKLWLMAGIVIFLVLALSEFLFHVVVLQPMYVQTAQLWRTEQDAQKHWPMLWIGQAIFAFAFAFVFTKGYEDKGPLEGVRYGFYMFLVIEPWRVLTQCAVMPVPWRLCLYWLGVGLVEFLLCGLVLASIYRESAA